MKNSTVKRKNVKTSDKYVAKDLILALDLLLLRDSVLRNDLMKISFYWKMNGE
jgi:hypothetical protein